MQKFTALFAAALLTAGMISAPAMAQDTNGQAQQQTQQAAPTAQDFTDEQLQQFADASQQIAAISQKYTQKLQGTDDQSKQQAIRKEANDKMVSVVQDSGLTVETFNAIGQAIQQDPELMKRVQGMANES
ncbi:DUF4168 domain-containing protein [Modicisalibacter tunisiensis]|uniref:DUF4168 domain-containing protein n=1 Tax=Modicisalibacter tunisiensis TaxID=390637 RepID=A0ABS7WUF6_9GAMM|nr:DUF4168 domain-containing protein [Modicisalibacter tunisiensis]KXS38499.1 MAG: hypothetical protein AWU55_1475 [Halomonadaceae bacterium T82-2]MBZ9540332.1 DUF4168 domain-containing protein [Modicisalibacter tunisiensis]MBZ9566233.1 DUF4168 domain-containing protein [Modicisalibacter tunisiensis]